MSTTPTPLAPVRQRDDMLLGSPEQDYILRIEPKDAHARAAEEHAAALTVCGQLGALYPDLNRHEVVNTARLLLGQLGLLDGLFVGAHGERPQAA